MSDPNHIFVRVGGTRFVATMASGLASTLLLAFGHLSGDQYVELGIWTIGVFIAGNASQNIAGFMAGKRGTNTTGGSNEST